MRMRFLKTVAAFAVLFAAVSGAAVPALAGENESGYAEFTNDPNNTPDIYVRKTAVSAVPEIVPPDVEFRFVIKVNGRFYSEREYEVYNSDGVRIYRKDTPGVDVPFSTDRNGGFTLRSGQTARFPWVGKNASYEVWEEETEGFVQTKPAPGGAMIGTVEAAGSVADFVNTYYPETTGTSARLLVAETVLLPDGYLLPEAANEAFTFKLEISSRPFANQPYTLSDGTRDVTDADGQFCLRSGQTAAFDVEAGLDYSVEQVNMPGNWRLTASVGERGVTRAPVTYAGFTNAIAGFAVKKRMEGYSLPDEDFAFVLSDGNGAPTGGASYYLYDDRKDLVRETLSETDKQGRFALKPGQTALFIGVESGTAYTVRETKTDGYKQTFPNGAFTGVVRDDAVPVYEFVNAADGDAKLTLKKVGESGKPLEGAAFRLRRGQGPFPTYAILEPGDGEWRITGWGERGTEVVTDAGGEFVISGFAAGAYSLIEEQAPEEYVKMEPVEFDVSIADPDNELFDIALRRSAENAERADAELTGSMSDGTAFLTLTNRLRPNTPSTGGPGRGAVVAVGIAAAFAGAVLIFVAVRHKKKDE